MIFFMLTCLHFIFYILYYTYRNNKKERKRVMKFKSFLVWGLATLCVSAFAAN